MREKLKQKKKDRKTKKTRFLAFFLFWTRKKLKNQPAETEPAEQRAAKMYTLDALFESVQLPANIYAEFLRVMHERTTLSDEELRNLLRKQFEMSLTDNTLVTVFDTCVTFPLWPPKDAARTGGAPDDRVVAVLEPKGPKMSLLFVGRAADVRAAVRRWTSRNGADAPRTVLTATQHKTAQKAARTRDPFLDEVDPEW